MRRSSKKWYFSGYPSIQIQSNPAISNSVNSKSPLFRRKIECPWIYPSPLRFPGYFEAPLFRTFFHFPWDFEIVGFDCTLTFLLLRNRRLNFSTGSLLGAWRRGPNSIIISVINILHTTRSQFHFLYFLYNNTFFNVQLTPRLLQQRN